MTCNKNCIHYPVCELKKYDFANIDECQYYEESIPQGKWEIISTGEGTNFYGCSECQSAGDFWDKFCRRCGSEMVGNEYD